jgi:cysteine desulfurase / selenocysteine lyase
VVGSYNSPDIEFRLKPGAERWEGGSFNMPGLQALGASVRLLLEIGPETVSERILDRSQAVRALARSAGWQVFGSNHPEDLSGIVALTCPGVDPDRAARALRYRGVAVASRRGRLRVSAHIYNSDDDLGRLDEGLRDLRSS